MVVLVCGGRDYDNEARVHETLDAIHQHEHRIEKVVTGGAKREDRRVRPTRIIGADYFAERWAALRRVGCRVYHADWTDHGRAAGPIRNTAMLQSEMPDLVVAFPGGRGTADMVRKARAAGVRVIEVKEE